MMDLRRRAMVGAGDNKLWLIKDGVYNPDLHFARNDSGGDDSYIKIRLKTGYVEFDTSGGLGTFTSYKTTSKIDITGYTKCYADFKFTKNPTWARQTECMFAITNEHEKSSPVRSFINIDYRMQNFERQSEEESIADVTGSYYLCAPMQIKVGSGNPTFYVYNVWLE